MKFKKKDKIKHVNKKKWSLTKNIIKMVGIHLHGTRGKETRGPRGNKKY